MMDGKHRFLLVCLVAVYLVNKGLSLVEFTNIKCETVDKEFSDFEYCHLKSINRTYKYFTLKVRLFKVPINKVKVNLALYKRLNGLKPFLYNVTVDGCKFIKNTRVNPVARFFYDCFRNFSNMNHSCPYDHDLLLDKVSSESVNHRISNMLPFPEGSYMLKTDWFAYNSKKAVVNIYLTLS